MSAVMMMSNMLDIMSGPGMVPARGCSDFNHFTISALISAAILICHAFWGVIAGKNWEQVRGRWRMWVGEGEGTRGLVMEERVWEGALAWLVGGQVKIVWTEIRCGA